jgi:hypothetical protein
MSNKSAKCFPFQSGAEAVQSNFFIKTATSNNLSKLMVLSVKKLSQSRRVAKVLLGVFATLREN